MPITRIAAAAALSVVSLTSLAQAGGFAIREQSTIGQGLSFAGVAAGTGGLSSLFWNPAVSAEYNEFGFISESNAALLLPQAQTDGAGPLDSGNIGEWAVVPASSYSYAINDRLTVAATLSSPVGLTTDADDRWAGTIAGNLSEVRTYNFNPSASYKVNDMFSVGVGLQLEYMKAHLTNSFPEDGGLFSGVETLDAKGDSFGFGFTAGLLFEPTDSTDIGIGFRSSVAHTLEGDVEAFFVGVSGFEAKFKSPEIVTVGIRQQVSDQLAVMAGFEWANWSRFKRLELELDVGGNLTEPANYKDSWMVSMGAEYLVNDGFVVRAGAGFEKSPVVDEWRGVRVPDSDRLWLSAGASYKFSENMTAHLAYTHVLFDDAPIVASTGLPVEFESSLDIISIGMTRDW
jgi:long-chain fatty acid transport protein